MTDGFDRQLSQRGSSVTRNARHNSGLAEYRYLSNMALSERVSFLHRRLDEFRSEIEELKHRHRSSVRWLISIALSASLGLFGVIVILVLKLLESSA